MDLNNLKQYAVFEMPGCHVARVGVQETNHKHTKTTIWYSKQNRIIRILAECVIPTSTNEDDEFDSYNDEEPGFRFPDLLAKDLSATDCGAKSAGDLCLMADDEETFTRWLMAFTSLTELPAFC